MNKKLMAGILLIASLKIFSQETSPEGWIKLYEISDIPEYKVEVLESITSETDPAYSLFIENNINWLSRNIDLPPYNEGEALAVKQALLIINEAPKYNLINSAEALANIYKRSEIYDIKIAAIKVLGNLQATDQNELLIQGLQYCNSYQSVTKDINLEIMASALIEALGKLKPESAFEELLYATDSWYSAHIKEAAYKVLISLADDPSELIMTRGKELPIRYSGRLLQLIMDSNASVENKEATILFLLDLLYKNRNSEYAMEMTRDRTNAVMSLTALKSKNPGNVELLKKVYLNSEDNTLRRAILENLGINGSDEAVSFLGDKVLEFKDISASRRGLSHDQLSELKQIISSLKRSGHPDAETFLTYIVISDFTPSIKQMASDAIEGMK